MQEAKFTTQNEFNLMTGIQHVVGAKEDGYFGPQSFVDLATVLRITDCFPCTISMYGCPVIVARDVVVCDPNSSVRPYENSISGSFTYPSSDKPCSILVNNGADVFSTACHASIPSLKKPETVIARYNSGAYWQGRCMTTADIRNRKDVDWAVGGTGLLNLYNPEAEGFSGAYADVLRKTNHTVLAVKNGYCFLVYCPNMTALAIQELCATKFKFEMAILLDGGHIAAINGTEKFAEINMSQYQGYILQGVK